VPWISRNQNFWEAKYIDTVFSSLIEKANPLFNASLEIQLYWPCVNSTNFYPFEGILADNSPFMKRGKMISLFRDSRMFENCPLFLLETAIALLYLSRTTLELLHFL